MMILVTGGSGSGKSLLAEKICMRLDVTPLYYIATMQVYDAECERRIARHRRQRDGKGFFTMEAPKQLTAHLNEMQPKGGALLECVGNLIANEQFSGEKSTAEHTAETVLHDILELRRHLTALVVVTNEVCADLLPQNRDTLTYLQNIGAVNVGLAKEADVVIEAVCGQPILWKGAEQYHEIMD